MEPSLAAEVGRALGSSVIRTQGVHGGDVAIAYRADLADGRRVFVKTHRSPPPGFFTTEATSLRWLAGAGAVDLPAVLASSDGPPAYLALAWIEVGGDPIDADADLGRRLAALHQVGAPCFGRADGRSTGSRGLPNEPTPTWVRFYAHCRLLPLAKLAVDASALPAAAIDDLERLADRLHEVGGPEEPPARLHGDLWAGNRLVDVDGRNWLIDPSAHGGHREYDLAMMRLFGGFGPACFAAYEEVFPLATGWQERVALHQIAPLVVHAIKFHGSYVPAATDAIRRYVGRR